MHMYTTSTNIDYLQEGGYVRVSSVSLNTERQLEGVIIGVKFGKAPKLTTDQVKKRKSHGYGSI